VNVYPRDGGSSYENGHKESSGKKDGKGDAAQYSGASSSHWSSASAKPKEYKTTTLYKTECALSATFPKDADFVPRQGCV
jgi:hypothetical protein